MAETPLKSVRKKCLDCCCKQSEEVTLCPVEDCALWPYRLGAYPEDHAGPKSVLKPIKNKCRDCMPEPFAPGQKAVKDCQLTDCFLWPYRLGRNPARKGQGRRGVNPFLNSGI